MVIGDTHGNTTWLRSYIYPVAVALKADAIIQVGDFGYWEHTPAGVQFLNDVDRLAQAAGIPLHWLRGNHDKTSLCEKKYGEEVDSDGFLVVRPNVLYIPDGLVWAWKGRTFRAFGGAYSVDKNWRLRQQTLNQEHLIKKEGFRAAAEGREPRPTPSQAGTLWFPEEEMSDGDMQRYLSEDSSPMDYVFSHDKPRSTNPGWNRKDLPLCQPNQDRLQWALKAHTPSYWFHGHLHYHYRQRIHGVEPGGRGTTVLSLEPDEAAAEVNWRRGQTWALIEMTGIVSDTVTMGVDFAEELTQQVMTEAKSALAKGLDRV